jgi:hypothetical protein
VFYKKKTEMFRHLIRNKSFLQKQIIASCKLSTCTAYCHKVETLTNLQRQTIELQVFEDHGRKALKKFEFPFVWLRDNCMVNLIIENLNHSILIEYIIFQCEMCFHETSHSRTIDWEHFDVSIKPKSVQVSK